MKKIIFLVFAVLQVNGKAVDSTQETEADIQPSDKETLTKGDPRWVNSYDQPLHFTCPTYQSINHIRSVHDNKHEDRLWDLTCGAAFDTSPSCSWSTYVNGFDQDIDYSCPGQSIISGMYSYHENRYEDRRWKFYCCNVARLCKESCYWTPYLNNFDEAFSWAVPKYYYLAGVSSYHANKQEDRRWRYQVCTRRSC
ncbi:hemagglutinin/amebocyte aggregation factor-like [Huso huso]|uniref:Hemagglutinin/amebocyte aggregation factor-like n=1 Tax=Huso huso TaxID=61971 RepID=A0ABR0Y8M8_HUSHU